MNRFKNIILIIFAAGMFASCKKFVEVETPNSLLLNKDLFANGKSAETALAGMYIHMRTYGMLSAASGNGALITFGLYADEVQYVSQTVNEYYQFYHYFVQSINPRLKDYWSYPYQTIYLANSILEAEKNSTSLSQEVRDRLKGEALFVRALNHFYLTNTFGSIPYVTSTDFHKTNQQGKIAVKEIYKLVLEDLKTAEGLLKETYPIAERVRANKWVVKAFMARVYLYDQDYQNAIKKSSEVIANNTMYSLEPDLNKVFLKESKEAIWQFKPSQDGINTFEGQFLIMTQDPNIFGYPITQGFLDAHEAGDQRKEKWIGTFSSATATWHYPFKYKQRSSTGTVSLEYSVLFRLAEQHLIRSEAYAKSGDIENSLKDLNLIRNRAGLPVFETSLTEDLLEAILKERRIELFMEYGHRFFDLKRAGKADQYLKPVKPNWKNDFSLWPIPYADLEANKNLLPQNPGYQ